jgi:hypothetical protein
MIIFKPALAASSSADASGWLGKIGIKLPALGDLVSSALKIAFFAAALFFFIQFIIGGFSWIAAGGDQKALDSARSRLTNAVIGLLIVVAAFGITYIILSALHMNIFSGETIIIGK